MNSNFHTKNAHLTNNEYDLDVILSDLHHGIVVIKPHRVPVDDLYLGVDW